MACILLWSSAVRVHDSQAYRKMSVTRERISRILELKAAVRHKCRNINHRQRCTLLSCAGKLCSNNRCYFFSLLSCVTSVVRTINVNVAVYYLALFTVVLKEHGKRRNNNTC